ncbi:MAG: RluA family pseudouridine synthase [Eubacteriales bacterium]
MVCRITDAESGMTVKAYLHTKLCLSGAQVTQLKKDAVGICVNGAHVTVRYVLQKGDVLTLAAEDTVSSESIAAVRLPLCILYEDDCVMLLDKPPYMPTHPSHGHYTDTLANGLAYLFAERGVPFVFRSCSRLDRDTSGVVAVAKNRAAAYHFQRAHASGNIKKEYLAVLCGTLTPAEGEITGCIRRERESVITRVVTKNDGARALTRYRVLSYGRDDAGNPMTLVSANPVTGRTHQLRVHFASRGCPILGDFLYGEENNPYIGRQALHCRRTSFAHPVSGVRMTVCAPPPDDFSALLAFFTPGILQREEKDIP